MKYFTEPPAPDRGVWVTLCANTAEKHPLERTHASRAYYNQIGIPHFGR